MQLRLQAGFQVVLSAEFLRRHSYNVGGWQILHNRPDAVDFDVAREFAALTLHHFTAQAPPVFKLQKPFGNNKIMAEKQGQPKKSQRRWTNPVRFFR